MKLLLLLLTVFGSLIIPGFARADWVVLSAAAKCDKDHGIFSLVPVVRTSSEEYDVVAPKGFIEFKENEGQQFICKLEGATIYLLISRWEPQARGMGQGAGVIVINKFSINGKEIIKHQTNFLWQTIDERVLTRITVKRSHGGFQASYCYSGGFSWNKQSPIKDMKCLPSLEPE